MLEVISPCPVPVASVTIIVTVYYNTLGWFILFILVNRQLDRVRQMGAGRPNVGCRHVQCRLHPLPSIGPAVGGKFWEALISGFCYYKSTRFSQLQSLQDWSLDCTHLFWNKDHYTHTNQHSLLIVSSITRSYVLCLISFYNPQNYYTGIHTFTWYIEIGCVGDCLQWQSSGYFSSNKIFMQPFKVGKIFFTSEYYHSSLDYVIVQHHIVHGSKY